ncbi:hypothetical protein DYB38_010206 [Aphanomyces astaci]|uniref:Uncharacterized protein n=1 Tax=Aphanomyces astaci TaxID=112090 RepID=A0A397CJZ7_APHAT|nr:hypothetical protein DYB38_010206 [Aphanomyces astaci]
MAAVASAASFRVASAPVDRHLTAEQQYRAEKFVGFSIGVQPKKKDPPAASRKKAKTTLSLRVLLQKKKTATWQPSKTRRAKFVELLARSAASVSMMLPRHPRRRTHSLTDYLFVPVLPSAHIQNEEGDIRAGQKPTGGFFELPDEFRSANKHTSKQPNAHSAEGPPKRTARTPKSSGAATDTYELPHGASVGVESVILDGPSRRLAGQQQHAGQDLLTVGLDTLRDFLFVPVLPYSIGADEAKAEPTPSDDAGAVGIQQVGHESPSD